ncbi:MAG: Gfo/Idh/MocA family oxidoreductase, partial [Candidatus Acidiferrales bacterium]
MGRKRAAALGPEAELVCVADAYLEAARDLALQYGAKWEGGAACWRTLIAQNVDVVIVSTSHVALAAISIAALNADKHVLVEKPAGRTVSELFALRRVQCDHDSVLRVGCNHRFHPGIAQARDWLGAGLIGDVLHIKARYGHGGRRGYESEWRMRPALSGGGELIDQGVHLIDLCNWLVGAFELEWGDISAQHWKSPVEDNALVVLRRGPVRATLQVSCTEWVNTFEFEIFGALGKIAVKGLGRSYGPEKARLTVLDETEMWPPARDGTIVYEDKDVSWRAEWLGFVAAIEASKRGPVGPERVSDNATIQDAERAMRIVHDVYRRCDASWLSEAR